jgi:nickel/cobalt exporter
MASDDRMMNRSSAVSSTRVSHVCGETAGTEAGRYRAARNSPNLWLILLTILFFPVFALGHPLGNESVNHISILWIMPDRVEFDLFLDFAETPSQPYAEQIDTNKDGQSSVEEQKAWLKKKAAEYTPFLTLTIDGQPIPLTAPDQAHDPLTGKKMASIPGLIKIAGVAGMPTYKTLTRFVGSYPKPLTPGEHVLTYEDTTFGQAAGLKRIVLEQVPSVKVLDPHPAFLDPEGTAFLYDQYDPANLPQERRATINFRLPTGPGREPTNQSPERERRVSDQSPERERRVSDGTPKRQQEGTAPLSPLSPGRAAGGVRGSVTSRPEVSDEQSPAYLASITDPRNDPAKTSQSSRQAHRIVGLLQGRWGFTVLLTITVLSFVWGAAHALMPGHAKTVVAAYLISRSGNYWHAVVLAIVVTITHTALVVILGLVIWLYQASHPALGARLQLWLGIVAGLLVAVMGLTLIWRALTGRLAQHHHDHNHDHESRSWFRGISTHSHPPLPQAEGEGGKEGQRDGGTEGQTEPRPESKRGASLATATGAQHKHEQEHHHAHAHSHGHHHPHGHEHSHTHHTHPHDHHHDDVPTLAYKSEIRNPKSEIDAQPLTLRMLLLLGITGGLVPCPTATIILLLGIGANVVAGALYAVGVFSLGLALTLMVIGFLALSSRRIAARILSDAGQEGELSTTGRRILLQAIPALSGAMVVALGLAIAANYTYHLLWGQPLIGWLG